MQLKMSKTFNPKFVKELLQGEDAFLTQLFEKMPVSVGQLDINETEEKDEASIKSPMKGKLPLVKNVKRAQTFEELQSRLDELRGSKNLDYKQKLFRKALKNKIKKKTKKEERRNKKLKIRSTSPSVDKVSLDNVETPKVPKPKPVFNSEGRMVFSKFDFSEIGTKKKVSKVDKDPKKILQHLELKKEKLKQLEQEGEKEKVQEIKEKEVWKAALARSSGEKVKDDPLLLKKSIKKQEERKKQSSKKWESRVENLQKMKQEKQEKRQSNIKKKKKEKDLHKLKKAAKRGRIIPGF